MVFTFKKRQEAEDIPRKLTDMHDLALLANTPAQTEFLLYGQEQAAGAIWVYVNTNKTEFMYSE